MNVVTAAGQGNEDIPSNEEYIASGLCKPGRHCWQREQCLICTVCHECTGYGALCVSNSKKDRKPGAWVFSVVKIILLMQYVILNILSS